MPKGPQEMMHAVIANLPNKTGKSLAQWLTILKKDGPAVPKEQVQWLKTVHDVGHVTAQIIVANAEGKGDEYAATDKLVDGLFGKSNPFRAIYEKVLAETKALPGAEAKPCKTYVPFVRRVQFARIKPFGKSHVDLLLALGDAGVAAKGRLAPLKSREARMSHVVKLNTPEDVDVDVRKWLKQAWSEAD